MHVVTIPADADPNVATIVAALRGPNISSVFVAGAPGFGKSSVLVAALRQLQVTTKLTPVWVSGGSIASEAHLVSVITKALHRLEWANRSLGYLCDRLVEAQPPIVMAIDDFDTLVFKRERMAGTLGSILSRNPANRVVASLRAGVKDRFMSSSHPFLAALGDRAIAVTLQPLDYQSAVELIRRRTPRLSSQVTRALIAAAGGHPAALVYLARLAELRESDERSVESLVVTASEFAGAVYAESWASLGPQQRAILRELSTHSTATAADVARAINLPASQVSAQITRLIADGLARREEQRGHHSVAPLLARWIDRRAIRSAPVAVSPTQAVHRLRPPHARRRPKAAVRRGRR